MNKDYASGIIFAVGMALFGRGMYELGKSQAQKEDTKRWIALQKLLENLKKERAKKKES